MNHSAEKCWKDEGQGRFYVPRGTERKQIHLPDQEARQPPKTMTYIQVQHQVILSLRSVIQNPNCGTTPNA